MNGYESSDARLAALREKLTAPPRDSQWLADSHAPGGEFRGYDEMWVYQYPNRDAGAWFTGSPSEAIVAARIASGDVTR